jgi:N-acetylmuramate 1-kinase
MRETAEVIKSYLASKGLPPEFVELTPDASTREYFRIRWNGTTAIACAYAEPIDKEEHPYIDVTSLFRSANLPVAEILDVDQVRGIIITEDFGDRILREELDAASEEESDRRINEGISLIARIQAATGRAFESDSVATRLKFDVEKLSWELGFFATHYFETLSRRPLSGPVKAKLELEFNDISSELEARASVLCHRDFHAANLMIGPDDELKIIDHQDARIGTVSYDLVSLLLDRITSLPSETWLAEKRRLLVAFRNELGLPPISDDEFEIEFHLQTIQRCLKAAGTFSFQAAQRGKTHFIKYIGPMFMAAIRASETLDRFEVLHETLRDELIEKAP